MMCIDLIHFEVSVPLHSTKCHRLLWYHFSRPIQQARDIDTNFRHLSNYIISLNKESWGLRFWCVMENGTVRLKLLMQKFLHRLKWSPEGRIHDRVHGNTTIVKVTQWNHLFIPCNALKYPKRFCCIDFTMTWEGIEWTDLGCSLGTPKIAYLLSASHQEPCYVSLNSIWL